MRVGQLRVGMYVVRASGGVGVITGWKLVPGVMTMYNLEVAQDHTFTVGAGQWVVHNCASSPRQPFDIVKYGDKVPGYENHHGIMDAWAKNNIPGYISRDPDGPAMALTQSQHLATQVVYRNWLFDKTGRPVGATVNWPTISPGEILELSESMFDAAGVPSEARQAYYRALNQYLYTGSFTP